MLFKAYRWHVRSLAKTALREMAASEADVIAFSKKDFSKGLPFFRVPDKADEIILDGEFYDVKDVEISDDSVFLFAYRDSDEKKLVEQYEKSAGENDRSPVATLLQHFSSIFIFIAPSESHTLSTDQTGIIVRMIFEKQISPVFISSDSPPPWV